MGCGICCLKCLLIMSNVIFGIIGAVLLAAGAFVMASANKYLKPFIDDALNSIPGLPDSFSLENAGQVPVGGVTLDVTKLLNSVAICLIVMGVFLLVCAIFGSCGACCSNTCMLYSYAAIVSVLFLVQLILVILFFSGGLDGTIKNKMKGTITNEFIGIDDFGLWSLAWNVLMTKFKCCGVDGYQDFANAKKWNKDREMTIVGVTVKYTLQTPYACCKFSGDFPNLDPVDQLCSVYPQDLISNWNKGCWDPLWAELESLMKMMVGGAAGILIFQAACIVAAIVVAVFIQKEKNAVV